MLGRVKLASSKKQGKRPVRTCRLFSGRPASCMRRCRGSKLNSVSFTSNTTARGLAGIVVTYTLDVWGVGGCASLLAFWLEMLCGGWARLLGVVRRYSSLHSRTGPAQHNNNNHKMQRAFLPGLGLLAHRHT